MDKAFLSQLKLTSCDQILRGLVREIDADPKTEWRSVTVVSGTQSYTGVPIKIEEVRGQAMLALYADNGGLRGVEALTVLPLASIQSVTLLEMRGQLETLGVNSVSAAELERAMSRLEIERSLKEIPVRTEINWQGAEGENLARLNLGSTSHALKEIFSQFATDPLAREAVAQIGAIEVVWVVDATLQVEVAAGKLKIEVGAGAKSKKIGIDLKALIERKI